MLFLSLKAISEISKNPPAAIAAAQQRDSRDLKRVEALAQSTLKVAEANKPLPVRSVPQVAGKDVSVEMQALQSNVDATSSFLGGKISSLTDKVRQSVASLGSVGTKADQAMMAALAAAQDLRSEKMKLETKLALLSADHAQMGEALSGNIELLLENEDETISAAELNAAAALAFTKEFDVAIVSTFEYEGDTTTKTHPWAASPVVIAAEAVSDVDVVAPTVKWRDDEDESPKFTKGILRLKVIFDTDANATKTYSVDDTVTVEVKASSDNKLLGWPVASVTKTYTVVA